MDCCKCLYPMQIDVFMNIITIFVLCN
uniref:Uncharacterized protein n=1 Tax=Arundo donax TaxID=35708 RepID=A0A0A8YRK5_ARUDO